MPAKEITRKPISHTSQQDLLLSKEVFEQLDRQYSIASPLKAALFFYATHPWVSLSEISEKYNIPRYKLAKAFKEKYGLESLRPYKATRKNALGKEIKMWVEAKRDADKINPLVREYFIPRNAYFNINLLGDIIRKFPAPDITVRLTREQDMETSLKKLVLKNLEKALQNEYEFINLNQFGVRKVTPEQQETLNEILDAAKKKLDKIGFDAKLCPAYTPSDKDARGKTRMLVDPQTGHLFSNPVLAIPFFDYQPPKRLQIAAHLMSKKHTFKLLNPEKPIVSAQEVNGLPEKYKSLDRIIEGVNLKVRFPRTKEENDLTKEGAIILTKKAAEKLRYKVEYPKKIYVKRLSDLKPEGTIVQRGEPMVKSDALERNYLFRKFLEAPITGRIVYVGEPKKRHRKDMGTYYQIDTKIVRISEPRVGDKLTSRTALKGVVGKIIDDDKYGAEMIIHPTEVWKEDEKKSDGTIKDNYQKRRGGMVLELLKSGGKLYVSYDEGEFVYDTISDKFTLSPTVLSGMFARGAKYDDIDPYIPKGVLRDIFESLHLVIVKMPDGSYAIAQDTKSPTGKYTFKLDPPEDLYGVKYDRMKVPPPLQIVGVNARGDIYNKVLTKQNLDAIPPYLRGKIYQMMRKSGLFLIFNNVMRPTYRIDSSSGKSKPGAYYTRIVGRAIKPTEIALSKEVMDFLKVKEGDYVSIIKEPVTTKWGVETLKVVRDDSVQWAAGINPYAAAKLFNADFDGDNITIFTPPLDPKKFAPTQKQIHEEIEKKRKKDLELLKQAKNMMKYLESLDVRRVPEAELAKRTKIYNETVAKHDNKLIKNRGGPKLDYIFAYPDIAKAMKLDINTVNEALDIEKAMKHKPLTPTAKMELIEKYGKEAVEKTFKLMEEEEEKDMEREHAVKDIIKKYVAEFIKPDDGLVTLRNLYKKQELYPSQAKLIGVRLYPDRYFIHKLIIDAFGEPYDYSKNPDRFRLFTKRKQAYKISYQIKKLEDILNRTLRQMRNAERKKDAKMYEFHKARAKKMRDALISRIKEAIVMYTTKELNLDTRVQKELPILKEKLDKYKSLDL